MYSSFAGVEQEREETWLVVMTDNTGLMLELLFELCKNNNTNNIHRHQREEVPAVETVIKCCISTARDE